MNYYTSPSDRRTKPVEGIANTPAGVETIPGPEGEGNVRIIRHEAPEWALVDFQDVDDALHNGGCACHRSEDWGSY